MHILMATVEALNIPADDIVLNRTSLQECRESNRKSQYDEAKSEFIDNVIIRISNLEIYFIFKLALLLLFPL